MCAALKLEVLKKLEDLVADIRNEYCHGSDHDDVEEFLTRLCNSVDSRNVLTIYEVEEYEAMEAAGEILSGKELEDAYSKINVEDAENEEENNSIIEEIEAIDSHIELLSQLTKTVNKEIQHVCSGMHQLQQQEKAAHYNQLSVAKQCMKLDSKVYSTQKDLIRQLCCVAEVSADYQNMKNPQFIGQMPYETYKKLCFQFDHYVKTLMKQLLDWNKPTRKYAIDKIDDLEQSYIEMKMEYLYMSAVEKGKKEAIKMLHEKINNIQSSKSMLTLNEIRNRSLLLEDKVSRMKDEVMFLLENEIIPAVKDRVEKEVLNIKKYRNEHKVCKQKHLYKQLETLAQCMDAGLLNSELLLLLFAIERQKLTDVVDLYQQCHEEINEDYSQYLLRMKAMQELKEKYKSSTVENPLIECIGRLLDEEYCLVVPTDYNELLLKVKKLNHDIEENEEKRLFIVNKQKIMLFQSERFLRDADTVLCSGLAKKFLIQNVEILTQCNDIQQLMDSFQEILTQLTNKFQSKKDFFLENPLQQEQRLLWIYFLMDPKKLVSLVDHLQELHERKLNKKFAAQKKKIQFLPYKIQK